MAARSKICLSVLGLNLLLGTGSLWLTQSIIAPMTAQAYKARTDVFLDRLRDETYQSFIHRAEIIARAGAQRSFDRDILISNVSVMVIGRHNGTETPVLMLEVSRSNWRERPDTRRWATYYRMAQTLLQLPSSGDPVIPNAGGGQPPGLPSIDSAPIQNVPVNVPNPTSTAAPVAPVPATQPVPVAPNAVPVAPATPNATPTNSDSKTKEADAAKAAADAAAKAAAEATPKQP
jgi:hypothetical protein